MLSLINTNKNTAIAIKVETTATIPVTTKIVSHLVKSPFQKYRKMGEILQQIESSHKHWKLALNKAFKCHSTLF